MVVVFPELLEDQLLYDACGRYADWMNYPLAHTALVNLFGGKQATAIYDFPTNLTRFLRNLPSNTYTANQIIDQHTLLPLYAPFLPPEQLKKVREYMTNGYNQSISVSIGINKYEESHQPPRYFRYCPLCAKEDIATYGYCYWHRTHQMGGVDICGKHGVWLVVSSTPVRSRNASKSRFFSAERSVSELELTRYVNMEDKYHRIQLRLAQDNLWLLQQPNLIMGPAEIASRMRVLLSQKGLATVKGIPNLPAIRIAILGHYGKDVLTRMGVGIDGTKRDWIWKILKISDISLSPLYYLIFIHFLGYSAKEFFLLNPKIQPFGIGPWPCFNSVASHGYRANTITECEVTQVQDRYSREFEGVFKCDCGFTYKVRSNQRFPTEILQSKNIISRGLIWDVEFSKQWDNPEVDWTEIRNTFKLGTKLAEQEAVRLSLSLARQSRNTRGFHHKKTYRHKLEWQILLSKKRTEWLKILATNSDLSRSSLRVKFIDYYTWLWRNDKTWLTDHLPFSDHYLARNHESLEEMREIFRSVWEQLRRENPDKSRTQLRELDLPTYNWLIRNDKYWLEAKMPSQQRRSQGLSTEEWERIDRELTSKLHQAATKIKNNGPKLRQITFTSLFNEVKSWEYIKFHQRKLPVTWSLANQLVESNVDFALRRLAHSVEYFVEKDEIPMPSRLLSHAHLYRYRDEPTIIQALVDALETIKESLLKIHAGEYYIKRPAEN